MHRDSLGVALASVSAQTDAAIEVVVINAKGGEHPDVGPRCGPHDLRLVNQSGPPLDRPTAANLGIDQARGQWLLFLDDDDLVDPDHVARLRDTLQAHPDAVAAYTGARLVSPDGQPAGLLDEPFDPVRMWLANYIPIHAVMFSRPVVVAAGLRFDPGLPVYEDWDFWHQLSRLGRFVHRDGPSATYRLVGESGLSSQASAQIARAGRARIYAKWVRQMDGETLDRVMTAAEHSRIGLISRSAELRELAADMATQGARAAQQLAAAEQLHQQVVDELIRQRDAEHTARLVVEATLRSTMSELDQQTEAASVLSQQLAAAGAEGQRLQQHIDALVNSTSWRVTEPLRRLRSFCSEPSLGRLLRAARFLLPARARQALKLRLVTGGAWSRGLLRAASVPASSSIDGVENDVTPPLDKEAVRAAAEAALGDFLAGTGTLNLRVGTGRPAVSVIVVLYNQAGLSLLCLQALSRSLDVDFETLIVDNASRDRMPQLLQRVAGARVMRQDENLGFLRAVNLAAAHATGELLLLLNNDAVVEPGTLAHAVARLRSESDAGAVGGPILLWDGRLQEAGSVIWRDGSCQGYGRGDSPEAPAYRFVRDVDYCSGAFLMIRRALFEQLGRFDEIFVPAYYEETDFCVRLWESGHRVVYDPAVRVKHFEFASDTGSGQALALQARNRERFCARHADYLAGRPVAHPSRMLQARSIVRAGVRRVLIIDDRVPLPALGRGYPRAADLAAAVRATGAQLTYYPLQFADCEWDDVRATLDERTEVVLGEGVAGLSDFLQRRQGCFDLAFVSRPHNMQLVNAVRDRHPRVLDGARMVYDAEALFSMREIERAKVRGTPLPAAHEQDLLQQELHMARRADRVVAVSEDEARHFRQAGCADVVVLGHALPLQASRTGFGDRGGYLFVGAITQDDCPNGDSMLWFAREVWPRVRDALGSEARLDLVGVCESETVRALASESIRIHGRVEDLTPFFERARVFVVPTRYAAGVPHKAHEAASRGLPMVVSPLIARQLGWGEREVLVGADGPAFAQACIRLHQDGQLWAELRAALTSAVERDCSQAAFERSVREILA